MDASARIYARLLRIYPARFRASYGDEMVQLFADQLRDARSSQLRGGIALTWLRTIADLATSAIAEHGRRETEMGQSLEIYRPTPVARLLALVGVVGALLLLAAFVSFNPFDDRLLNVIRLSLFCLGGATIALAFHGRQAVLAPRLAAVATGAVVFGGSAYALWVVVSYMIDSPFSGPYGFLGFAGGIALWGSAALFGAATLKTGAAWQGMASGPALATRLGALALAIGSPLAMLGIDRFELTRNAAYGELFSTVALAGIALNGAGWMLLGLSVVVAGWRGARTT